MFEEESRIRKYPNGRIRAAFTDEQLEYLYSLVYCHDLPDNNEKADYIQQIIGPEFEEVGTGTNRFCAIKDGYTWKFALDNRGIRDNVTEFFRSPELPEYLTTTYETNGIVLIAEYVTLMEESEFTGNTSQIKTMLDDIAQSYIFGDLGLVTKNFCNYGYRGTEKNPTLVILDYAYMYPIIGNEEALICPKCGAQLINTTNYSGYICSNTVCGTKYSFMDVRRRMNHDFENKEASQFDPKPGLIIHTLKEIERYILEHSEM